MSSEEDITKTQNQDGVKSYYKSLTLQKKYGTTGSIEMENGAIYIGKDWLWIWFVLYNCCSLGDVDENGVRLGMGHLEIKNGSTYNGSFDKGLPNGIGVMRFPDSSRYEGEFMQGWFHGYGVFSTIDGMKFEGEFRW